MILVAQPTNAELIAKAAADDSLAWEELVDRFAGVVWHVVGGFRQLDHARRSDVFQTTWLKLAESLDTIRDPDRLAGWLATTARRESIRLVEMQRREVPTTLLADRADVVRLDAHLLDDERDASIWQAFERLEERCQQLLRLLLADPAFSYDEIAALMDMAVGSIGPTRQRCLDKLRRQPGVEELRGTS
jgi:RNA polymerase sigma factor (sigma-70 family)